jgi:hypothetical protein
MTFFFTFGLWKTIGYFGMCMTTIIKIESIVINFGHKSNDLQPTY